MSAAVRSAVKVFVTGTLRSAPTCALATPATVTESPPVAGKVRSGKRPSAREYGRSSTRGRAGSPSKPATIPSRSRKRNPSVRFQARHSTSSFFRGMKRRKFIPKRLSAFG